MNRVGYSDLATYVTLKPLEREILHQFKGVNELVRHRILPLQPSPFEGISKQLKENKVQIVVVTTHGHK